MASKVTAEITTEREQQTKRSGNTVCLFIMQKRGYESLKGLLEVLPPSVIEKVVSTRDKAVKENFFEEIQALCAEHGIPCYDRAEYPAVESAVSLAIGWRWMINGIDKIIVMHDSLLPKYRGFAPIVSMLLQGETHLGVTAFWAAEEYDAGDIIMQRSVPVHYPIKIREAVDLLAPVFKELTQSLVRQYVETGSLESVAQDHSKASFSLWRDEMDYQIDWAKDADYIKRFVDAVGYPYDGAYTYMGQKKVRILDGQPVADKVVYDRAAHIGKLIQVRDGQPVIVCGTGLFSISQLADENGNNLLPLKKFRVRFTKSPV